MRNHHKTLCVFTAVAAVMAVVPSFACAQQLAYTLKEVNLRAGPSRDYPVVAHLGAGTSITIFGCLQDYRWCDVVIGGSRGWVYSGNIVYPYLGQNVPIMSYGSTIGLGIVNFSIDNYWDNYYTDYPWYPQRQNWDSRPWVGYGSSGYGTGYGWRAPTARTGAVSVVPRPPQVQVRPVSPPQVQVRPVSPPQLRVAPPQRIGPPGAPPARVQGVGQPLSPGQPRQTPRNAPQQAQPDYLRN